jgi:tRNA nucleotidyltransferase (CCA-adding enzyme)
LRERLKYTTFEKELSLFIIQHRDVIPDTKPLRPYQMLAVDHYKKQKEGLQFVTELLRYQGYKDLVEEFQKWTPPKFPVGGNELKTLNVPSTFTSVQFKLFFSVLVSLQCSVL